MSYCNNLVDTATQNMRDACKDGANKGADDRKSEEDNGATPAETNKGDCAGVDTAIIKCDAKSSDGTDNNGVWALLLMAINILTAGVGIAAVGGIIYGSIMYTTAGDNEGQVKQAKEIIRNVIIGIIAYVAMYALLQFIVPGGVFDRSYTLPVASDSPSHSGGSGPGSGPGTGTGSDDTSDARADITTVTSVNNIRDASSTSGGDVLKPGVLYRSAQMDRLNNKDASTLSELLAGGTIIDLRTDHGRNEAPDKPVDGVRRVNIPIGGILDTAPMVTDPTRSAQLAKALKTAAHSDGPVYIHCVAGKDRTGWMVAMIMYAVGANDQQVMKEYLKSSEDFPGGVKREWLNHGLQEARSQYGSVIGYLKHIGLSDGDLSTIKKKFGA